MRKFKTDTMVSLVANKPTTSKGPVSLGYDFALLGLPAREARVEVIRNAAESAAVKIQNAVDEDQRVEMLAELAASTYRLLDPRRRKRILERIQLSNLSEIETTIASVAKVPLVDPQRDNDTAPQDALVVAELIESAQADGDASSHGEGTSSQDTNCMTVQRKSLQDVTCPCDPSGRSTSLRIRTTRSSHRRFGCRMGLIALGTLSAFITSVTAIAWMVLN